MCKSLKPPAYEACSDITHIHTYTHTHTHTDTHTYPRSIKDLQQVLVVVNQGSGILFERVCVEGETHPRTGTPHHIVYDARGEDGFVGGVETCVVSVCVCVCVGVYGCKCGWMYLIGCVETCVCVYICVCICVQVFVFLP